ncbi:MAG: hypothetical protein SGILL_001730, partial [Bacillariaceae sp.]
SLFTLESKMYQDIHHSNRQQDRVDKQQQQRALDSMHRETQKEMDVLLGHLPSDAAGNALPTSRNGLIKRGSLRTTRLSTGGDIDQLFLEKVDVEAPKGTGTVSGSVDKSKDVKVSAEDDKKKQSSKMSADRKQQLFEVLSIKTYSSSSTKSSLIPPRVFILDDSIMPSAISSSQTAKRVEAMGNPSTLKPHLPRAFEKPYYEHCEPAVDFTINPTCNALHEWSMESDKISLLSDKGSWRLAWKVDLGNVGGPSNGTSATSNATTTLQHNNTFTLNATAFSPTGSAAVVLKNLHVYRDFDLTSYQLHATDIMVMDRLTASRHVVSAYGFCGQSVITEYADSSGREYVKRYDIRNRDRLRVARDLAHGLAEIQALRPLRNISRDTDSSLAPLFAHNDINIANTVMVNGKMKWNDFNIGEMLRLFNKNATTTTSSKVSNVNNNNNTKFAPFTDTNTNNGTDHVCPVPVKFRSPLWRSPEENLNKSYVRVDASDVYGFGNILYQTMTRHQPWTHKEPEGKLTLDDIANRKLDGKFPTIPEQYYNTTKRELQIMYVATVACYNPDPNRRPSARQLAYGLQTLYERMKNKTRIPRTDILDLLLPT